MEYSYPIVGFVVGVVVGLTGVGGGSLMTPMLVFVFKVSPLTAVGTDLLFASATKIIGVAAHGWRKQIDWKIFGHLAAGSLPAAMLSVLVLSILKANGHDLTSIVLPLLGSALLLTALAIIYRQRFQSLVLKRDGQPMEPPRAKTIAVGAILGVLVSFTSVGAGALGVAALMILYPALTPGRIVGTDLAHAIPLVTIAGLGHLQLGNVNYALLVSLLIGSIPGIWIGAALSSRLPEMYMRKILIAVLFTVGLVCIWR